MSIGIWQLLLILVIVFVIFGAGKLPRVMGDIGKGARALKKGLKEDEATPNDSVDAKTIDVKVEPVSEKSDKA